MIEVTGLSSVIDTESLRVSGLGNARLLVVNCLRERFAEISESDPIRVLNSQKRELQAKRDARKAEIDILREFGEKIGEKPEIAPDQANAFANTFFEKSLACAEAVAALDNKIEEIERKINKAESGKAGSTSVKAVITIVASDDGPVRLKLAYRRSQFTLFVVHLITHFQVWEMPLGLHYMIYMPFRKKGFRPSLCPFTIASICNKRQGRTGAMQN